MSLLSKLERLEKFAASRDEDRFEVSPEVITAAVRILAEFKARPEPTIHERIAWLHGRIKKNEALPEDDKFLDAWCRTELARAEALAAKLS